MVGSRTRCLRRVAAAAAVAPAGAGFAGEDPSGRSAVAGAAIVAMLVFGMRALGDAGFVAQTPMQRNNNAASGLGLRSPSKLVDLTGRSALALNATRRATAGELSRHLQVDEHALSRHLLGP